MSSYLAIATVTAALQNILQTGIREAVPGSVVTTVRPDSSGNSNQATGINLYLYLATPNPNWRNADLRTRRPKGELIKHAQAGLDLYYLMTFYGNEQELEPQRLLGCAVRTLVDQPILTQEMIEEAIAQPNLPFLTDSTLSEQVQSVMFIPSNMTTEEMSRIWSVFFQVPYSISFAFQATAVLIQGDKPGKMSLPVRRRAIFTAPVRPAIDRIEPDRMITLDSTLLIVGRQLLRYEQSPHAQPNEPAEKEMVTRLKIGPAVLTPLEAEVGNEQIKLDLSSLSPPERATLQAGVQGIQVIHINLRQDAIAFESNVMPLVLCPTIVQGSVGITVTSLEEQENNRYNGEVNIQVDVNVDRGQRVFLLLNGMNQNAQNYVFRGSRRAEPTSTLHFSIQSVNADSYLVRIQIDGAESLLEFDEEMQQFTSPIIQIGANNP